MKSKTMRFYELHTEYLSKVELYRLNNQKELYRFQLKHLAFLLKETPKEYFADVLSQVRTIQEKLEITIALIKAEQATAIEFLDSSKKHLSLVKQQPNKGE